MIKSVTTVSYNLPYEDIQHIIAKHLRIPIEELKFAINLRDVSSDNERHPRYEIGSIDVSHIKNKS